MKKRICFVVATPLVAKSFLKDHIIALSKNYDVFIATNIYTVGDITQIKVKDYFHFGLVRNISIINDFKALWQLFRYFRRMKFDAVHSVTPKAGLVTAIAALLAGVLHRTHIFTGQVWSTRKGFMRWLLKSMDKIIALLDNHILVDGESQRQYLIKNGIIEDSNSRVLGAGSICGVNIEKFHPDDNERIRVREEFSLGCDNVVFAFMGRLNREKGIYELFEAFNNIAYNHTEAVLACWGRDEGNCLVNLSKFDNIKEGKNFFFYGYSSSPGTDLQACDVFVMPSYREGFGSSVIEASCLGLPVICSDAYGIMDAMVDGETGLRCKVADVHSLQKAMETLLNNAQLRQQLGENGRKRVLEKFRGDVITAEWERYYQEILK